MADGRQQAAWEHTSLMAAVFVNSNPNRTGDPVSPADFNPFHAKKLAARKPIELPLRTLLPLLG